MLHSILILGLFAQLWVKTKYASNFHSVRFRRLQIPSPGGIYLLKVNNRNTRTKVWNMFKVNNKATGAVLVALFLTFNIFHTFVLVFLLLTLNM